MESLHVSSKYQKVETTVHMFPIYIEGLIFGFCQVSLNQIIVKMTIFVFNHNNLIFRSFVSLNQIELIERYSSTVTHSPYLVCL